ncbi:hypothetical protein VNI00_006971 [Paramarasmius palmivorus]|uniref:Peroxidase n=1 Tax=Paramarasmius palmivorus TaxID=297713 RepID=A0AAW0D352_9AGAR
MGALHLASATGTMDLHWPYPQQLTHQEELLYENGVTSLTINCPVRDSTTVPAQWVRLAYHDMSTHNIEDGTGGLDGSIRFELDRGENIGSGMEATLRDVTGFQAPFTSLADLIAMMAVTAYPSCGGPFIPYRAGRVDATTAGVPGVPEPQQDIESHIESFRLQGFSQPEMIGLVACGHALGGVSKQDFPTMGLENDFELFHGGLQFDHAVVTGWLDGSTPNPLVTTPNETMRADLRIFGSDGNATMQSLAAGEAFNKTCSSLIERMVETVPRGVTLTDVILPIENKVGNARLFVSKDKDSLVFTTDLRLLNPTNNPSRTVTLLWADRQGSFCPSSGCSAEAVSSKVLPGDDLLGFVVYGGSAIRYNFEALVDPESSISKFWFEIDEHDGSEKIVLNNGGDGYAIDQDTILFDPIRSSIGPFFPNMEKHITVAIKGGASRVYSRLFKIPRGLSTPPPMIPEYTTQDLPLDTEMPPRVGYTFYTASISFFESWFEFHAEIDGEDVSQGWISEKEIRTFL